MTWRPARDLASAAAGCSFRRRAGMSRPGDRVVTITAGDQPSRTVHGQDVHDALHLVMEDVRGIAEGTRCFLLTVHTIDGDPVASAELAEELGFVECVRGEGGSEAILAR